MNELVIAVLRLGSWLPRNLVETGKSNCLENFTVPATRSTPCLVVVQVQRPLIPDHLVSNSFLSPSSLPSWRLGFGKVISESFSKKRPSSKDRIPKIKVGTKQNLKRLSP